MKNTIKTVVIGFIAGIAGAFAYQQLNFDVINKADFLISGEETTTVPQFTRHLEETKPQPYVSIPLGETEDINFVTASRASTPSVVYIKTISRTQVASSWMDYFFGDRVGQTISSGSGVIYSKNGYIVTNNHVIDNADEIEVTVGKKTYSADIVGRDPSTDLAVLKVQAQNLPNITIGNSREVEVGEWVLAVGNPFNLTSTVTAGIVSAKGRDLNILKSNFPIESFIQTDAAINPGNSGGALVNLKGELVGINTAILSRTGSYAGYGFAVPSEIVKKIVNDIIKYGMVQKAFFGGEVMDIDSDIASKLELNNYEGVVLGYIQEGGPADQAGFKKGDIILSINNEKVETRSEFEELISYFSPGDVLKVSYKRNNSVKTANVTLINKEGTTELLKREIFTSGTLGADLEKVSKVERNLLNIEHGVRIVNVRNGFIKQMKLDEGFIVCYINKIPINTPEELSDILEKIRGRVYVEGVNKRGQWEYHRYYF